MAETPLGLWSPDVTDGFSWIAHLALMQQTVDAAIMARANKVGPRNDRLTHSEEAVAGDMWYDTDDSGAYIWTGSAWQEITHTPALFYASRATAISVPDGVTMRDIPMLTVRVAKNMSMSGGRAVVHVPGVYLVGGSVAYAANGTGNRALQITASDDTIPSISALTAGFSGNTNSFNTSGMMTGLEAGDTIELQSWQTSGGYLNMNAATLWAVRVS